MRVLVYLVKSGTETVQSLVLLTERFQVKTSQLLSIPHGLTYKFTVHKFFWPCCFQKHEDRQQKSRFKITSLELLKKQEKLELNSLPSLFHNSKGGSWPQLQRKRCVRAEAVQEKKGSWHLCIQQYPKACSPVVNT